MAAHAFLALLVAAALLAATVALDDERPRRAPRPTRARGRHRAPRRQWQPTIPVLASRRPA